MKIANPTAVILSLLIAGILSIAASVADGRSAALGNAGKSVTSLLHEMVGTWNVQQRMWTGPDAKAIDLPPAIAHRRLVAGAYLQEIMEPAHEGGNGSFIRTAYINYNPVRRRYEYFSVDSRAPQQMHYQSAQRDKNDASAVKFQGGHFVAAQWGDARNVAFKYRLVLGEVKNNQQVVQLYLTPQSGKKRKEFMAFEYVYTRQH